MERIEYVPKRARLLGLLAGALGFVVVAAAEIVVGFRVDILRNPILVLVGAVGILFFGACAVAIGKEVFDRRPTLVLDETGLFDRRMKTPVIPWTSILDARVVQIKRTKFISLTLIDEEERLRNLPPFQRKLAAMNQGLGFGRFNVNLSALGVSAETILQTIETEVSKVRSV